MDQGKKDELAVLLNIAEKQKRVSDIQNEMMEPNFWVDYEKANKISQELSNLQAILKRFDEAIEDKDLSLLSEELFYTGEHDDSDVYLSVHAGAGGTEAQDWAHMLLRMYQRFAEKGAYATTLIEESLGEEVGIKSATIQIKGYRAYGNLKSENGIHRLVRISPFDADKARHTSFALVEVVPSIDKTTIEINPDDLKIDVYRSGGHGGQSVNTTDSAVRITHIPSKIVVTCQNERSQLQNKALAMKILEAKLQVLKEEQERVEELKIKGGIISASWGNQIRSYVLQPYQLVKDLRTGYETNAVNDVLNGDIRGFIEAYLKYTFKGKD